MAVKKPKKSNTQIITRQFKLYPLHSIDNKFWVKRVRQYFESMLSECDEKIVEYQEWIANTKTEKKKKSYKNSLETMKRRKTRLLDEQNLFETIVTNYNNGIELSQFESDSLSKIAKDYTYQMIHSSCKSEALRKNRTVRYVLSEYTMRELINIQDDKEREKKIAEIINFCNRTKSKKEVDTPHSLLDIYNIDNPLGGYGFSYKQSLTNKLKTIIYEDIKGKADTTPPFFKSDSPFTIEASHFNIIPNFDLIGVATPKGLQSKIQENENNKIIMNFGSNKTPTISKFKVYIGSKKKNKEELYSVLFRIFSGENQIAGSSIKIDKDKDIILNLSISIPLIVEEKLNPNIVCGVDLGMTVPAVCALNNDKYKREYIGSGDTVKSVRAKFRAQRRRLQRALKLTGGGKGRKKKLKALDNLKSSERRWAETYNHKIAKQIVDFAYNNGAKYIKMEDLSDYKKDEIDHRFCLRNWGYAQLQQFVEYKARLKGIIVLYVKAAYTSQTCHCCGYVDSNNRPKGHKGQAYFKCLNCGTEMNADFNGAKNIAASTDYTDKNDKAVLDNLPSFMRGKN